MKNITNEDLMELVDMEIELEDAQNLVLCFVEFCDDEGLLLPNDTQFDQRAKAEQFIRRVPQHLPMLRSALGILAKNRQQLLRLSD